MGWSTSEELLCIQTDGLVLRYDLFGNFQHHMFVDEEPKSTRVIDARVFATVDGSGAATSGVAVMTTNFRVFLVNNVRDPKACRLADIPSEWVWRVRVFDRSVSLDH